MEKRPTLMMLMLAMMLVGRGGASSPENSDPPVPAGVWPLPAKMSCTSGVATAISPDVKLTATGAGASTDVTIASLSRYKAIILAGSVNLPTTADERLGASAEQQQAAAAGITSITVAVGSGAASLSANTDYSYTLKINAAAGEVTATAASSFAVAYALEAFSQLLDKDGKLLCSTAIVVDKPQFVHRGLMIDTGRRFYPLTFVKSIVDGLAMSRMNVLHFHLSEECFRVESLKFPQLVQNCIAGGHNNTAFYTQQDIAELVAYSRLRGVRVLPGEAASLLAGCSFQGIACSAAR
jgi:hexosaminidase